MAYTQASPYYNTQSVSDEYIDIMVNRNLSSDISDQYWEITATYHQRPDMLAYDLYNDSKLWWVFAQRNPNTLKDPMFDFTAGTKIFIPQITTLQQDLGI